MGNEGRRHGCCCLTHMRLPASPHTSLLCWDLPPAVMTNKYSEGYPGARYYGGNEFIDQAERLCQVGRGQACRVGQGGHIWAAVCAVRVGRRALAGGPPKRHQAKQRGSAGWPAVGGSSSARRAGGQSTWSSLRPFLFDPLAASQRSAPGPAPPCRSAPWRRLAWTPLSGASTCRPCRARPPTLRCVPAGGGYGEAHQPRVPAPKWQALVRGAAPGLAL